MIAFPPARPTSQADEPSLYERSSEQLAETCASLDKVATDFIRSRPGLCVSLAIALGVTIGCLIKRR